MEYLITNKYLYTFENTIFHIVLQFTGYVVDKIVLTELTCKILRYTSPVDNDNCIELQTYWLNEQRIDLTISLVAHYVDAMTKLRDDKIELNSQF